MAEAPSTSFTSHPSIGVSLYRGRVQPRPRYCGNQPYGDGATYGPEEADD